MADDMTDDLIDASASSDNDATDVVDGPKSPRATKPASAKTNGMIGKVKETASALVNEASGAARSAATEGKSKATEALGTMSRIVENAADMVEEKIGPTYGNYARKAASSVSNFTQTLENKDIDELVDDARDFVRKSPLVAIGAAAAIGFALTRIAKIGVDPETGAHDA